MGDVQWGHLMTHVMKLLLDIDESEVNEVNEVNLMDFESCYIKVEALLRRQNLRRNAIRLPKSRHSSRPWISMTSRRDM